MSKEATMKKLFSLVIAVLFCAPVFAGQSSADLVTGNGNNNGVGYGVGGTPPAAANGLNAGVHALSTPTTNTQFPTYVAPPPAGTQFPTYIAPPPAPAPTPSINPAANQGQQSQNGGAGANAAAGAALIAAGMALMSNPPTVPAGAALVAMGILALAQSAHDSNAAGQSGATAASSVNGVGANPANPTLGAGTPGFVDPNVAAGKNALGQAGYTVNGDGLQTPSGSVIPNSAFNSAGGMAKAGMDASTIKEVQNALATVNGDASRAKVSGVAVGEGGGGVSNDHSGDGGGGGGGGSSTYVNPFQMNSDLKKQMVAGKTVLFDGDPIGVRGQDIFEMIHTCYEKKRSRNDFLDESGGVGARQPASVPSVMPAKRPAFTSNARVK